MKHLRPSTNRSRRGFSLLEVMLALALVGFMGLGAYIVYGLGWLPGSNRIAAALNVFGAPAVVVVAMILPLLWLQVRSLAARR